MTASTPTGAPLTVGVALCTFNGARYLEEQLGSILGQTRAPHEIVIADDGSTDDTLGIVHRFLETERDALDAAGTTVRVLVSAPGHGVAANFERAIAATSANLVALSDQDDVWQPDRLARQAARFDHDLKLTLLHADARLVDASGRALGLTLFESLSVRDSEIDEIHRGAAASVYLKRNLATGATMMFRRALFEVASPFGRGWVHDEWLAMIAATTGIVDVSRDPVIDYRQHGANEIGASDPSLTHKLARLLEPRGERNRGLADRSEILAHRLEAIAGSVHPGVLELARAKARFERRRAGLPDARALRLFGVARESVRGDYGRFASQGARDILRDLVQPAH